MSKKKFVWEVYLRPNTLSKDTERDCIADVRFRGGAKRNEDIADVITKERSEFRRETIINILNLRDEAVKNFIQDGMSFIDGIVQIAPRVTGVWKTENSPYNAAVHKRTVDLIPTHDFKAVLDDITVKVLGLKDDSFRITSVTDIATGLSDGTIMIGDDLIIEGEKIKVDESDAAQGVFFKGTDGTEHKTSRRLSVNKPGQLIARVPSSLPEGKTTIIVRTKYSSGAKPLAEVREIVFKTPCTAKA